MEPLLRIGALDLTELGELNNARVIDLLDQRGGELRHVKGNGTCWLYAALGAMGVLEHAWEPSKYVSGERMPSSRDVHLSEVLLEEMKTHLLTIPVPSEPRAGGVTDANYDNYKELVNRMRTQNVWTPAMGSSMAMYGNRLLLALLCRAIDRHIVVLYGPAMATLRSRRSEPLPIPPTLLPPPPRTLTPHPPSR